MPATVAPRPRPRAPGEMLQVGPDNPAASNGALREANRLLEQHEYERAEPILTRLVRENPDDPEPLASLAVCVAAGRSQFATAEKLARRARNLDPARGCGWFALGYVNLLGSRLEKGFRYLEEGRRRDPRDPRLRWGDDAIDHRRPAGKSRRSVAGTRGLALAFVRRVVADRRVLAAGVLYVVYQAATIYFRHA
jgi:tetratricopeptide (TPR) repeat protein